MCGIIHLRHFFTAFAIFTFAVVGMTSCQNSDTMKRNIKDYPVYSGTDLGLTFGTEKIFLRTWSPEAEVVRVKVYGSPLGGEPEAELNAESSEAGVWTTEIDGDSYGKYYTIQARISGKWRGEVPGPYAVAAGTNGLRAQFIDPSRENPEGWENDAAPPLNSPDEIVLYELHIRDFSIHPESGMEAKGKYMAFTERGTATPDGIPTGVDHLVDLGVTHVHLLPSFDFLSIDESNPDKPQFNWGYDPQNFNVPEGSYSTNAADGAVRIREFKAMVKALHNAGIRVVMDVVYNHTGKVDGLSFEELVPGYYYRHNDDGSLSNASGCGNEVASERPMVRKFIIESLVHWVEEYHIDGFRFDLMAIHDMETMREIEKTLHDIDPDIFIYGEGWTAGDSPLPYDDRALKQHTWKMPNIAAFSDDLRDGIKGSWHDHDSKGFVSGNTEMKERVKFGIVGAIGHPGVNFADPQTPDTAWAMDPVQSIGYVSCHDNHTLFDKLTFANPKANSETIRKMHILSNAIVLTSQGVPFLHAGVEFMRTKGGEENSYKSPDSVNQIVWSEKAKHEDVYRAHRELIAMRKAHPAFRLGTADEVVARLKFLPGSESVVAYTIDSPEVDSWVEVFVAFNGGGQNAEIDLPSGKWTIFWKGSARETEGVMVAGKAAVPAYGALIAFKNR